ncbi:MAG: hypothetical protein M3R00_00715 [Pseudomonadota bacterium]|nr:hypothetical protein [Pseudomonadota bacterium]
MLDGLFKSINKNEVVIGSQEGWEANVKKHFSNKNLPYPDNQKSLLFLFHQEAVDPGTTVILLDLDKLEPFYHNARRDIAFGSSMQHK